MQTSAIYAGFQMQTSLMSALENLSSAIYQIRAVIAREYQYFMSINLTALDSSRLIKNIGSFYKYISIRKEHHKIYNHNKITEVRGGSYKLNRRRFNTNINKK